MTDEAVAAFADAVASQGQAVTDFCRTITHELAEVLARLDALEDANRALTNRIEAATRQTRVLPPSRAAGLDWLPVSSATAQRLYKALDLTGVLGVSEFVNQALDALEAETA